MKKVDDFSLVHKLGLIIIFFLFSTIRISAYVNNIESYITAVSIGGAIQSANDRILSGSQLNWSFYNNSTESVTLKSMQLIDGQTGQEGNIMSVNEDVGANSSVSYTTTIGVLGINMPVTCRFRYEYYGNTYSVDAVYSKTTFPDIPLPSDNHTLTIKVSGGGSASYNGSYVRNDIKTFEVRGLSSPSITFSPDNGYRIKSVKVNNSDVTSKLSNNSYTINIMSSDTTVEVEFEENGTVQSGYTINVTSSGNGWVEYNGDNIRNKTKNINVKGGADVTISINPDQGYQIKSVKVDGSDVTSKVSNNSYTISNVRAYTKVEVVFEAIPATTYVLTIKTSGNGSVTYDNTVIRSQSRSFTVNEGANATVTFSPDNGYRIKNVQVNGSDVSLNGSNNQYSINNIQRNTTLDVYFEAIPPKIYTLTITASGNGSATFDGNTVRAKSSSFSVNEGTNATITFTPDNGYRIKSVKVNNSDVTNNVSNNSYTINKVNSNTTLNVEFEAIPPTVYILTINAKGSGHVSCNDISVENGTQSISIEGGSSAIIKFYPNDGHQIKSAKVNNVDVTSNVLNYQYTIYKINANTTVEVEFEEIVNSMTAGGINYVVYDQQAKTIQVAAGSYGIVLEVPTIVWYSGRDWTVVGIKQDALINCPELAAIIWNPEVTFNARIDNPNLLLYVNDEKYAPRTVKNVVVKDIAESIELTDAANGNDFYCPRAFRAKNIIYKHNYQMETGIGDSRGWETIVLPFDVQKYTHATKGELESFSTWTKGSNKKPFWLFELTADGYKDVASIKANTPYIISMPNNQQYEQQYQIPGIVTFSASNVEVQKSDNLIPASYQGRTFVPNYINQNNLDFLALNINSNYVTYTGSDAGSKFIGGLRSVHPFEAYMITTDNTRSIDVMDGMPTSIKGVRMDSDEKSSMKVYDIRGRQMSVSAESLKPGIYIVNGKKMIIK